MFWSVTDIVFGVLITLSVLALCSALTIKDKCITVFHFVITPVLFLTSYFTLVGLSTLIALLLN